MSSRSSSTAVAPAAKRLKAVNTSASNVIPPLTTLARRVIVAHLERYAPSAWACLDQDEWQVLVQIKHSQTAPSKKCGASGGLDGTGRLTPAMSAKYLASVEEANPHLAESHQVDTLVWKDCVNYTFRSGGLTRPRALEYPWPMLVEKVKSVSSEIQEQLAAELTIQSENDSTNDQHDLQHGVAASNHHLLTRQALQSLSWLQSQPLNVALLQATGVGKTVKQIIKGLKKESATPTPSGVASAVLELEELLQKWKRLAANAGVEIKQQQSQTASSKATAKQQQEQEQTESVDQEQDLQLAETCQSWRQLHSSLQQREATRRSSQGKRMREIRQNLNQGRPKVVKVRPTASSKHSVGGTGRFSGSIVENSATPQGRISQLRHEAAVTSNRQRPPPAPVPTNKASFGAAVAFCNNKSTSKKSNGGGTALPGNKRLTIPTKVTQGAGPRQFASKYKQFKK